VHCAGVFDLAGEVKNMTYAQITPPSQEPVSLEDAKAFMRFEGTDEDDLITGLIATARDYLETVTGVSLVTQNWRLYRDGWPQSGLIALAHGPVRSVDTVRVFSRDGTASEVDLSAARLDGEARPARFYLREIISRATGFNGIEVDFTAGYGDASDVPAAARQAILRHVTHMFVFRGAIGPDQQPAGVPDGYERLIAPLKTWRL